MLFKSYKYGGFKNVNILENIVGLQRFWVQRLFDGNFNDLKVIPFYLIKNYLGKNFKFFLIYTLKSI